MQNAAAINHETSGQRLSLPAPYTIRNIEAIYDAIHDALLTRNEVILDLCSDAEPDLSFLQLVEIARTYATAQNRPFSLQHPASPLMREKLQIAGLVSQSDGEFHRFWFHQEAC